MSLTVRSEIMEHVRSTIVTTAVLVAGLMTAAQVLHPRDAASEMRRQSPAIAATAWNDPPARVAPAGSSETALVRPAAFTLLPAAMTASLSGAGEQRDARPLRKAEPIRGRRSAQSHVRDASSPVGPPIGQQASNPVALTAGQGQAAQGDPIGDLMRTLGLGRGNEG